MDKTATHSPVHSKIYGSSRENTSSLSHDEVTFKCKFPNKKLKKKIKKGARAVSTVLGTNYLELSNVMRR